MPSPIRDAIRAWRRAPAVAAIAALSLALGIGATTTFYSLVDHLLLSSLPVPDPHELALVRTEAEPLSRFSFPVWEQIRERRHLYDSAFAWSAVPVNVAPQGEVDMAQAVLASGEVFGTLGVSPSIGRLFDDRDDGPQGGPDGLVAVISHAYWQRRFGGNPAILGQSLVVEGVPFTVVGVAPRALRGLRTGTTFDIALPLRTEPRVREFSFIQNGRIAFLTVTLRLAPGQPIDAVTARLREDQPAIRAATLSTTRRPQDRDAYLRRPFVVVPAADGGAGLSSYYGGAVRILFGLALLVLLACCGNVATVMLAHGAGRHHELGVRRALGASRWEAAKQLLADSLVLSVPGATAGLLLAVWAGPWILAQWSDVRLDDAVPVATNWRAWAVTAAAGLMTGILCGLAAAWRAARISAADPLRTSRVHTPSERGQRVFVGAQLAFSVVVAVTSALLLRSYYVVVSAPALDQLDRVTAVELRLARSNVPAGAREDTIERVRRAIAAAVPGVLTSISMTVPFHAGGYFWAVESADPAMSQQERMVLVDSVTPSHAAVLGATRLAGRGFDDRDVAGAADVGIVNRTFAQKFLGGGARVPQRVRFDAGPDIPEIEIVGVVDDVPYENVTDAPAPVLYLPRAQHVPGDDRAYVVVRPEAGAAVSAAVLRSAMANAEPGLSYQIVSVSQSARDMYARARALAMVAAFFVAVAVLIAGMGVFGVMSHAVTERRRELGVRLALGALPRQVAGLVMGRAARLTIASAGLGLAGAWWAARLTASLLIATDVHDPRVFLGAATMLIVTGLLAAWWPARRAARTDPAEIFRCE